MSIPMTSLLSRFLRISEQYAKTDMTYLVSAGFWMNLSTVSVSLFSLILYIVFAHVVPKEVFGTYQYLLSLMVAISALSLAGMNSAVIRAVAQGYEGTYRAAIRLQALWSLLPCVVALGIGAYYYVQNEYALATALVVIGILSPLNNVFNTYSAYLQGKRNFRSTYFYNLTQNIVYYSAMIVAAFFASGAIVLLLANLLSQGLGMYALHRYLLANYQPNDSVDPEALTYGKHLSLMAFFGTLGLQADNILAFHYLGPAALAVYAFSTAVPDRVGALFKFLPAAILPKLSTKSPEEVRAAFDRRLLIPLLSAVFITIVYIACAPFIYALLFPAYVESIPFSQLYALTIIATLANLFTAGLMAARHTKSLYIYNVTTPFVQIALQWVGVVMFGLWGLIIAKTASSFFALILGALLLRFSTSPASSR